MWFLLFVCVCVCVWVCVCVCVCVCVWVWVGVWVPVLATCLSLTPKEPRALSDLLLRCPGAQPDMVFLGRPRQVLRESSVMWVAVG
jgi:hypothetical protein